MNETLFLTKQELEALPIIEGVPTPVLPRKRWRRRAPDVGAWLVGEYIPYQEPGYIGIKWYEVKLRD